MDIINGTFDLYNPCDLALAKNGILKTRNICNEVSCDEFDFIAQRAEFSKKVCKPAHIGL